MLDFRAQPMPAWLPDETLFSLASRWHRLAGAPRAATTSLRLFGSAQTGTRHDFPSGLNHFSQESAGCWGNVYQLATRHTLLRFYQPFLPEALLENLIQQMAGSSIAHLKFKLGLLTSRFRAHHPLKACPLCMQSDRDQFGWAYWHLSHQYPGVWVCQTHGTPLQETIQKSTGVGRFLWHLPDETTLREWPPNTRRIMAAQQSVFIQLSQTIQAWIEGASRVPTEEFYLIYRRHLQERNWLPAGARLRMEEAARQYWQFIEPLTCVPELASLAADDKSAQMQLTRMLRPPRTRTHPLRHLVIMSWLQILPGYLDRQDRANLILKSSLATPETGDTAGQNRKAALVLSVRGGLSMRQAAILHGVDTQTAMVWAAQAGITCARRSKKLKFETRQKLIEAIRAGQDKQPLADAFGISVTTVTSVIRSEVGLHDAWQLARHDIKREQSRHDWLALLETYPGWGTKVLRHENSAAYMWLYRHDKEWLNSHLPEGVQNRVRASPVNWDKRDENLSMQVKRAALERVEAGHAPAFRLWELYQAVPELKAKLNALDRLPLTKQVIERLLRR